MSDENMPAGQADVQKQADGVENVENAELKAGVLKSEHDASFSDGLVLAVVAGRDAQFKDGAAGAVVVGANLQFTDGAAGAMVVGDSATVSDGIVVSAIIGGQANLQNSFCGVLLAGNAQLGEGSRVLLNTPQALALGAAFGAAFGLLSWLLRKK